MRLNSMVLACMLAMAASHGAKAQHSYSAPSMMIPGVGTTGVADRYPAYMAVSGVRRPIAKVRVILPLSHTYPDDLDIVLISPRGLAVVLMSDAGGSTPFTGTVIFQEGAPPIPDQGLLGSFETYSPADYEPGDPPPGLPSGLTFTTLGGLAGSDANGFWRVYVYDDASSDVGSISGMTIQITEATTGPVIIEDPYDGTIVDNALFERELLVSGVPGPVHNPRVRIYQLWHTYPSDLDIGVVDPQGQLYILMSDAGGGGDVDGVDLEFGAFPNPVPQFSLQSGQYQPTNYNDGDPLDLGGVLGLALAEGKDPNGVWRLLIQDDASSDAGFFEGWTLTFDEPCATDFNRSGASTVADIFAFLSAWFAGCP